MVTPSTERCEGEVAAAKKKTRPLGSGREVRAGDAQSDDGADEDDDDEDEEEVDDDDEEESDVLDDVVLVSLSDDPEDDELEEGRLSVL